MCIPILECPLSDPIVYSSHGEILGVRGHDEMTPKIYYLKVVRGARDNAQGWSFAKP